jgi:tetratricopeptide (TPR) repeat protein
MEVTAWVEKISISTYKIGAPEKNPMFLEKRVYQGSSGVVYPHPVIEQIADEKTSQEYTGVFLENEYLKIMILPELGGRVQRAYDKVRERDFVYYNRVIKPALVGLAGPWISGGIEFNWPQHHRPSTYSPVDFTIEENADGSKTVWMNEIELMFRTKGMAGFTLFPDKAYLEIKGKLFNRTPFPQTFLWWANPAVKVNDHYQSVFPPDVYAVFDHGKRDVSDFPIATGTYYKVNYAPGTDISRYANIPVPTSYMAIRSKYDFMGCYENDTRAGMLHVADHHVSPGKKQWTWGNSDFGQAWDRNLTDEDGPYIELMTGVFTDNQPDFSWLQPNEEKTFEQYFMPYTEVGMVKNATKEAILNLEWEGGKLTIKVYTTSIYKDARVSVFKKEELVKEYAATISPYEVFDQSLTPGEKGTPEDWKVEVTDSEGNILVGYQPDTELKKEIPSPATAAKLPAEIEQIEDLYLNGLHLEQYRHATFNPIDYYEEALRRSPGDIRCNNAMGLLLLRRGQFEKAEPYFRKAIQTLTQRNPNPYDGEPYYNLGWSLKLQDKLDEAYEAFYKATWSDAWQHSGFLSLARIASAKKNWKDALSLAEKSLVRNYHSPVTRQLKVALLRKACLAPAGSGSSNAGSAFTNISARLAFIQETLKIDPFNFGCLFERYLLYKEREDVSSAAAALATMKLLMRDSIQNYLELSLDYAQAGMYEDAGMVLDIFSEGKQQLPTLVPYYKGWFAVKNGHAESAQAYYKDAARQSPDLCFPNKIEEVLILQSALSLNPADARAHYYLGNFWYDKRQYPEAIARWKESARLDDRFPTVFRNLSLAAYNKLGEKDQSMKYMETAFSLDPSDSRILMELDQLYKITGRSFAERLDLLEKYPLLVEERDDLYLERITLYNNLQQYEKAKVLLAARKFHPWEGGEGKVVGQYLLCHIELAKQALSQREFQQAFDLLSVTQSYPVNLGEGKLYGAPENDSNYLLGCVYEGWGQQEKAMEKFREATTGNSTPVQAIYYNDPQPDKIIYQALAWWKLGEPGKARNIFEKFIEFGRQHMNDRITIDYFAVSLPDMLVFDQDINGRNKTHCNYLIGLGHLGLGDYTTAGKYLQEVIRSDGNHQGSAIYLQMFPFFKAAFKQDLAC